MAASRMATSIESILSGLLVPDNVIIAQATQELRKLFKDPNIIEHLLEVLCVSQNIQVRQYSAILLRKKIFRLKAWRKLPEDKRNELKRVLLLRITCEQEKAVVLAVGQLVAVVAKHECQTGRWTELQDFLNLLMNSKNVEECRLGFYIVSVVSSEASEIFLGHGKQLFNLFGSCLQSFADEHLCFYVIKSMTALVSSLDSDDAICFQALIPYVLEVIRRLVKVSEEKATEALEIFDELIDAKISILLPHIKPLVTMCLKIASDSKNGDMLRVRAMSVLSWMISVKKKTIVKHKLIPEILEALFPIMADVSHGELDSEIEDEDDEMHCQSPSACAAQLIDAMALHLPPEKLLPPLSQLTEKYLASDSPVQKRAAFLAIAFIAEGCSEAIRQKHLPMFVHIICRGVVYEEVFVRNAALFALGQFADFLQPEILKYASEIVPILLNHLGQTAEQMAHTGRDPPNLTKTFYALETFCENLEGELVTYLPAVMERVLVFLTAPTCRARELAISAIGSIACATEEAMLPYFPHIIGNLKQYLTEHQSGHNATLRAQAVDTLGCLARTMGATNFLPKAEDCVQLGLRLIDAVDDPDLRRSTFGMFAAVSSVLRADMTKYLEPILDHMFTSLRSTEGVVTQPVNAVGHGLELFEGLEESEDEAAEIDISGEGDTSDDDDDDSEQGYTVENAYLEEKEDTCVTLENLAGNIGPAFAPYLEKCFTEVLPMASHPASNVRKAALSCIGQLTVMLFKSAGDSVTIEDVSEAAGILIPKLVEIGHTDPDRDVVLTTLETLALLINELKGAAFESPSHVNDIVNLVKDAFNDKLASQDADSDGEDAEEQDEAEYDGLLVQMAGQLVPALAKALPAETFAPYLAGLLPLFLGKLKKQNSPSDRSYAVGTLAEVAEGLGKEGIGPFCKPLLPVFLASMQDQDSEVRSNAVFGLGILIQNAPDILAPAFVSVLLQHVLNMRTREYPSLLGALHSMLSQEDNRHAKDNICGAVARLILVGANSIPMGMVFPVLLQQLPLEEDFEENVSVFQCICYLYGCKRQELIQNLPSILRLILRVIGTDQVNADTRLSLVHLLKSMSSDFPNEVQQILQACTPQERETFNAVLTSS